MWQLSAWTRRGIIRGAIWSWLALPYSRDSFSICVFHTKLDTDSTATLPLRVAGYVVDSGDQPANCRCPRIGHRFVWQTPAQPSNGHFAIGEAAPCARGAASPHRSTEQHSHVRGRRGKQSRSRGQWLERLAPFRSSSRRTSAAVSRGRPAGLVGDVDVEGCLRHVQQAGSNP